MTRTMYDSTTAQDIPKSATMVAGYVDGNYKTVDALRKRFPKATIVTITVNGSTPGVHVIDCETGDATPAGAARWAKAEVAAGRHPTIYTNAAQWPTVKRAVRAAGLKASQLSYWIADYDNDPTIPKGAVAKQYANPDITGHHYDLSVVTDHWPGVDTDRAPKPPIVKPAARATRLNPMTRIALTYAIAHLNRRRAAVARVDRELLNKIQLAAQSALGIREKEH